MFRQNQTRRTSSTGCYRRLGVDAGLVEADDLVGTLGDHTDGAWFIALRCVHSLASEMPEALIDRVGDRTGRAGAPRRGGRTKSGGYRQGIVTVVMFVRVRQVRIAKRLNLARAAERWTRRLPGLIRRRVRAG